MPVCRYNPTEVPRPIFVSLAINNFLNCLEVLSPEEQSNYMRGPEARQTLERIEASFSQPEFTAMIQNESVMREIRPAISTLVTRVNTSFALSTQRAVLNTLFDPLFQQASNSNNNNPTNTNTIQATAQLNRVTGGGQVQAPRNPRSHILIGPYTRFHGTSYATPEPSPIVHSLIPPPREAPQDSGRSIIIDTRPHKP